MSCTDLVLLESNHRPSPTQHDPPTLAVGGQVPPTIQEQALPHQDAPPAHVQSPLPASWTEHPLARLSKPSFVKDHKRRKSSRSIFRPFSSSVSSSAASSKSKRSRKSRDLQPGRERTAGKKQRQSSRTVEYKSTRESQSALYRRPRGEDPRRIKRQPSNNGPSQDRMRTLVSPSLLSVLSALTGATESSSGSNTTVTQKSYDWTRNPSGPASRHHQRDYSRGSSRPTYARDRPRLARGLSNEAVDVFKFLEKDSAEQSGQGLSWSPPGSVSRNEQSHATYTHTPAASNGTRNVTFETKHMREDSACPDPLHSDSGVSVGGESPDFRRRTALHYIPPSAESVPEEEPSEGPKPLGHIEDVAYYDISYQDDANSTAMGTRYPSEALSGQQTLTPSPRPLGYNLPHSQVWGPPPVDHSNAKLTVTGYELLASKLSAIQSTEHQKHDFIVPLYRRFEPLHHRVLLHLQDEICELEEQLRQLDECIAQSQPVYEGVLRPASRREDVRFGDSLRYQRTDLLGRICMKLTTYNQALKSYKSVTKDAEDARQDEIQLYKEWLGRHQPIAKLESDFLDHGMDLMRISSWPRRSDAKNEDATSALENTLIIKPGTSGKWAIAGPPAGLLVTFIAFLVIPTLFGRLVVLSILAGLGYVLLYLGQVDEWMTGREMACCMGIYVGVMATIAGALQ